MAYETLLIERKAHLVTVTLNRPEKMNTINEQMIRELLAFFTEMRSDPEARLIIFAARGNLFSAGADMSILEQLCRDPSLPRQGQLLGHEFMRTLENLEQVTIAAVNGPAAGAGMSLTMACDFRIASVKAGFSVPEAAVGVFFTWGCTPRLAALVGPSKAKELIMTCDMIDAREALQIGLVNQVVPEEELMAACLNMADKISKRSPLAIRMTKKITNAATASGFGDLYLCEPELVERIYVSGHPEEGVRAFIEKRPPKFE